MTAFNGSRTEANLRQAFATATLAKRRYMAIADQAEAEGSHAAAALCRVIAASRGSQADAHLAWLEPCTAAKSTAYNVRLAMMDQMGACADAYPAMARAARQEGLDDVAAWFEVRAKGGRSHVARFRRVLEALL